MSKSAFSKEQIASANEHLRRTVAADRLTRRIAADRLTRPQVVTIAISGPCGTGKSFIKYEIAKMIKKKLKLKVEIEELEMQPKEITEFLLRKKEIKKALRNKGNIVYKVTDISTYHLIK